MANVAYTNALSAVNIDIPDDPFKVPTGCIVGFFPEVLLIKEFMCILNCSNTSLEALQDLEHKYTETSNTQF